MKKMKKIISLVVALTMSVSVFAGLTASAAEGDVLMEQNFDEAADGITRPWGEPSRGKSSCDYPSVDTLTGTVATKPETVLGNVFQYATQAGENVNVKFDMAPALSKAAETGVYNVKFDVFLNNALVGTGREETGNPDNFQYIVGFGTATGEGENAVATNVFEFKVYGDDLFYITNSAEVDTGIDLGTEGAWVSADLKCDVNNHKFSGTLTPFGGEAYTIVPTDFANNSATTIAQWYMSSIRISGSEKGHVSGYLDNFVVTEAVADTYSEVTINYVDGDGNTVKDTYVDSAIVGSAYNVPDLHKEIIASTDEAKYYEYVSGAEEITVIDGTNEITLVFELKDKVSYTVLAVDKEANTLATLAAGLVIPGEEVMAYADFALVKDGVAYAPASDTSVTYAPATGAEVAVIVYEPIAESKNIIYNFEDDVTGFTGNNEAAKVSIADVTDENVNANLNGEKVLKFESSGATASAVRTASLNVNPYTANHGTVVVNYDAYISSTGRMTLNFLDKAYSGYSDTGLFSIGVKDSGGFRVNGNQSNGANSWVHVSTKADFANDKLYYTVTDALTGKVIVSSSKDITGDVLQTLTFISWSDSSAYIDNIEVISTDRIIPDLEYTFEEDTESPLSNNAHAVSTVADATDTDAAAVIDASVNGTKVLKFTGDERTGEGTELQAVASIDISDATMGAKEVTVDYDSYVDEANVYFGIGADEVSNMSDEDILFSHGYRSAKKYYVINGESGSAYTGANGKWVHSKLVYNCDTGVLNYTLSSPDGITTYKTGSIQYDATAVKSVYLLSWSTNAIGYIDNIVVTTKKNDVVDFEDGEVLFTADENSTVEVVDATDAVVNADINGTSVVKFTANEGIGDKIKTTKAVYDISAVTADKAKVIVSYDSYVAEGMRAIVEVGDFSQGYGGQSYYLINNATGSAYTAAAGQWVNTVLEFDLNNREYTYTVKSIVDDSVYVTKTLETDLASVDSIELVAAASTSTAYIDNITVTGLGTYVAPAFPKAELSYDAETKTVTATTSDAEATGAVILVATKDADGVLTGVKSYTVTYAEGVASQVLDADLTVNDTVYLWSTLDGAMVPTAQTYVIATPDEA